MRFFCVTLLLLSLFLSLSTAVSGQYAGVFLNTRSKEVAAALKQLSNPHISPDISTVKTEAHHMTIEFRPNPLDKFKAFYGQQKNLKVLAYVHDSHGQAVLVDLEDNPCKTQGGIEIGNAWPHVTISHENKSPYTAVYSNDLVARAINQGFLKVKETDSYGKPTRVKLAPGIATAYNEFWGTSGNYTAPPTATTKEITYGATPIYIKVFPQEGRNVLRLKGTVCFNTNWNDTSVSCKL